MPLKPNGVGAYLELVIRLLSGERIDPRRYRDENGLTSEGARKRFDIVSTYFPLVRDHNKYWVLLDYLGKYEDAYDEQD